MSYFYLETHPEKQSELEQLGVTLEGTAFVGNNCEVGANSFLSDETRVNSRSIVGADTILHECARVTSESFVGSNCEIDEGTAIRHSQVGDNVHVETGCYIEHSKIGDDVWVGPNSVIVNSTIVNGAIIGEGSIVFDTEILPHDKVIPAGSMFAASCHASPTFFQAVWQHSQAIRTEAESYTHGKHRLDVHRARNDNDYLERMQP